MDEKSINELKKIFKELNISEIPKILKDMAPLENFIILKLIMQEHIK